MKLPPKLSAPALQANVIPTQVLKHMGRPEDYHGHWLHAGPGSGKTQLTRLWVQQVGRPYAWLQLDPQDNHPLLLLEQLCLALVPLLHPGVMIPSFSPQSGISMERHCEFLWQVVLDNLRAPCVIVLDDAHHIHNWPAHPVLNSLIKGLDPRAHLVVLSRTDIDDLYVRKIINRTIHRIGPESFQWQTPQLKAWIKRRWGSLSMDDNTANLLLALSRGRAGILALLDIQALLKEPSSLAKQAAAQLELSELMESSLLARLAPEDREALFWLACLGSFPSTWLSTLGFSPALQHFIHRWEQSSSVVHRLEQNKGELRFHPLFAEILRDPNSVAHSPSSKLRERIIDACIEKGRSIDAICLCRNTQHWNRYWALLQGIGIEWIKQGQVGSLAQALADVPEEILESFAGCTLSLFLAATNLERKPREAYEQALDALQQSQQAPEHREHWAMALAITANAVIASGLHMGYIQPVIEGIDAAIEAPWFLELPAPLRLMALQAGLIASIAGQDRPSIQALFYELERAMQQCPESELQAMTVSALARVVLLHGLPEFTESIKQHIHRVETLVHSPAAELALLHAKTTYHLTSGSFFEGLLAARALWSKSSPGQQSVWSIEVLASGAFCAANIHDLESTKFFLGHMLALRDHDNRPNLLAILHSQMYLGSMAAHEGRMQDAYKEYRRGQEAADEYQYSLMQVGARCCLAMICLDLDRAQEAKELLGELEALKLNIKHPLNRRLHTFLRSFIQIRTGPLDTSIALAREVLEEMEQSNSYLQVTAMLPHYAEFLCFGLTHNIKTELIHKIIRRGPIYPKKRPHPEWPSYIEVRVLGRFEIFINGKDARSKLVSSGRRFDLLTALLWWGGKDLSYEQCMTWIWHYIKEEARAIRSIKTAVRRLNEDFGRDDAILDRDGKISINPELWSYATMEPQQDIAALTRQLNHGFIGPTPIPAGMRDVVPSQGAIDFGPEPLLGYLGLPRVPQT